MDMGTVTANSQDLKIIPMTLPAIFFRPFDGPASVEALHSWVNISIKRQPELLMFPPMSDPENKLNSIQHSGFYPFPHQVKFSLRAGKR